MYLETRKSMTTMLRLGLILFSLQLAAQPDTLFVQANKDYQAHDYALAASRYDSIVKQGIANAETYYNLGNAHFRLGHIGLAILNYERALRINPSDEDALHNLDIANKQIVDTFTPVPAPITERIVRGIGVIDSTVWSLFALFFGALMLLTIALFLFKQRKDWFGAIAIIALILMLVSEVFAWSVHQLESRNYAIITAPNTYVKSGPSDLGTDLFILHEGTKVRVLDIYERWQKVRLPDGKMGWMPFDDAHVI